MALFVYRLLELLSAERRVIRLAIVLLDSRGSGARMDR